MKNILSFFVNHHKFTFTLTFFLIVFGLLGLRIMNRESYPPVDFARVIVTTIYPGSSPQEVEEKVTKKIEEEIRGVDGIKDVSSVSQSGRSEITIRVELDGFDINQVINDLQSAVQRVRGLPSGILEAPRFQRLNSKEIPIIKLGIMGSNEERRRDLLAEELKELLEDNKNISKISFTGFKKREFQILLYPARMKTHHIGISEVVDAVKKRSQNIPAGYIKSDSEQFLVRVHGQISNSKEMGDIVIRSNFSANMIKVKDIAKVLDSEEEETELIRLNDQPATLLTISKKEKADTIDTAKEIKNKIQHFEKKIPHGYKIIIYDNESEKVEERLKIVTNNAIGGLLIVFLVLLLFLPGGLGVTASLSLPLTLMATVGVMSKIGTNFNTITMLAMVIAIGMLVDNSVIVSENYARLRRGGMKAVDGAINAAHQFWIPISGTVATTIASFMPMLVTKGIMGDFIKYIPIIVSIALFMSLFESFFLLPARLKFTIKNIYGEQKKSWFENFSTKFEKFVFSSIKQRYLIVFFIFLLFWGSLVLSIFGNRFQLFPAEDVEKYYAKFELLDSATLKNVDDEGKKLTEEIRKVLGNDFIDYQISHAGLGSFGMRDTQKKNADNMGTITISIHREKAIGVNVQSVLDRLRTIQPGALKSLAFDSELRGPPVGQALAVTFRSNNINTLNLFVNEFKKKISEIDGIVDVSDDLETGKIEYELELDYEMMARLKLSTQDVGYCLRTALHGGIASELNIDNKEIDIRIRYSDESREKIDALKATKIMEPTGNLIPLTSITKIKQTIGPSTRRHLDFLRSTTVSANVVPKKITSLGANKQAMEIYEKLSNKFPGVTIRFGGEGESTRESLQSLANAMVLAILGIFIILVLLFDSFIKPFVILSSIPLGLIGISFAFFIHSRPISFFALTGIVGLSGVVVNSAIVLISYIDVLLKDNSITNKNEILAKASSHRLRAVLVTSLTTVAGLVPTAYSIGGHDAMLVPMTLALAWGLAGGTFLTLIWVPCLLSIIDDVISFLTIFFSKREMRGAK